MAASIHYLHQRTRIAALVIEKNDGKADVGQNSEAMCVYMYIDV